MLHLNFEGCDKPTEKMVLYAYRIHNHINDGYTQVQFETQALKNFESCSQYIEKFKIAYRDYCNDQYRNALEFRATIERGRGLGASAFSMGLGADDLGMSCTDVGICPWGDS